MRPNLEAATRTPEARPALIAGLAAVWVGIIGACVVPSLGIGETAAPPESGAEDGGDGDDGGNGGPSLLGCSLENVGDPSDCSGKCNAAIEGAEGVYRCTVTCDAVTQDCGEGYYCQLFQDGGTACLEDCNTGLCMDEADACDPVLKVCLPATTTDGDDDDGDGPREVTVTCTVSVVEDVKECDEDCDEPVYTGDGLYFCTNECDTEAQNCSGPAYRCEEVDDGTGACFLNCSDGKACPDEYACDQDLELCIPTRD